MNLQKLIPIELKRVDETSGHEFTFRVAPPIDFTAIGGIERWENNPKGFIEYFFWKVLIGEYDVFNLNKLEEDIVNVLPLLKELVESVNLEQLIDNPEGRFAFNISARSNLDINPAPSEEFLESLRKEVLLSKAMNVAMSWYVFVYHPSFKGNSLDGEATEYSNDTDSKKSRLFPNSHEVNLNSHFLSPQFLSNSWNKVVSNLSRADAIEQFNASDRFQHTPSYKIRKRPSDRTIKGETVTEFVFDPEKQAVRTAEQFFDQLIKLKDPEVLQRFFALMKWINLKDTFVFKDVPISEIMSLTLKPQGDNKFNKDDRKKFSAVLELLTTITITMKTQGERVNKNTGKRTPVLREEKGVKLFRLVAEYSVKKEFESKPKNELREGDYDKSVITRFSGEILPGNAHMFTTRGSIYSDALLRFDANKDSKAIILGFSLQTRFNQFQDKDKFVELDRAQLIDLCDYQKTNSQKASVATKRLANTLDKLIKAGIISKYSGLTNSDEDKVRIHPPGSHYKALPVEE